MQIKHQMAVWVTAGWLACAALGAEAAELSGPGAQALPGQRAGDVVQHPVPDVERSAPAAETSAHAWAGPPGWWTGLTLVAVLLLLARRRPPR